jgi:lactate permease
MGQDELVIIGRVLLALLLGCLIGMERTMHGRAAGFRTHALVCLASALLMMAAVYQGRWMSTNVIGSITLDVTRIAQGIMTGIANYQVPGLHNMISKVEPIVSKPTPEAAVFSFTWLSYTGSGMLIAAIISGLLMGISPAGLVRSYGRTLRVCAYSLITISAMLAIGTLTRLSGIDATLGLAFAATGLLYPFFGTLLGWLGVALTGSDTASNILFGNLQRITSEQLSISPILMSAANSSGGVMGKMIDAQSIVVASTATNWFGHEGTILRFVFWHSIALASLVGGFVMLQAYVLTGMIVQ